MTTIAAIWTPSGGAIGGDRRFTIGGEYVESVAPKVRLVAPWLAVGVCGAPQWYRWLRDLDAPDEPPVSLLDAAEWLERVLSPIREVADAPEKHNGSGTALTPWGLLYLAPEGAAQTIAPRAGIAIYGCGSGAAYAQGALLMATWGEARSPELAVLDALKVAAAWDICTGGPFDVLTMEGR